jgi:hypothetical protein
LILSPLGGDYDDIELLDCSCAVQRQHEVSKEHIVSIIDSEGKDKQVAKHKEAAR